MISSIRVSKILKSPLILGDSGFKKAIKELIFDPSELKLVGLSYLENKKKYVAKLSALTPISGGIGIKPEEISEQSEDKTLKSVLELDCPIIGQKVVDKDGRELGKVKDVILDLNLFYIVEIMVKGKQNLWIHRSLIISVTKDFVKVKSGKIKKLKSVEFKKVKGIRVVDPAGV